MRDSVGEQLSDLTNTICWDFPSKSPLIWTAHTQWAGTHCINYLDFSHSILRSIHAMRNIFIVRGLKSHIYFSLWHGLSLTCMSQLDDFRLTFTLSVAKGCINKVYLHLIIIIFTHKDLQYRKLCFVFTVRACETLTCVCVCAHVVLGYHCVNIALTTVVFIWSILTVSLSVTNLQCRDAWTIDAPELQLLPAGRQRMTCGTSNTYKHRVYCQMIR